MVATIKISQIMEKMPVDLLEDFSSFVKVSNDVKNYARSCNPSVVRIATRLERYKRSLLDSIKRKRDRGELDPDTAREIIQLIYDVYNKTLDTAEKEIESCFR